MSLLFLRNHVPIKTNTPISQKSLQHTRDRVQHRLVHLAVVLPVALHPLVLLPLTPPPRPHIRANVLVQREGLTLRRAHRGESHSKGVLLHRQEANLPFTPPATATIASFLSRAGNWLICYTSPPPPPPTNNMSLINTHSTALSIRSSTGPAKSTCCATVTGMEAGCCIPGTIVEGTMGCIGGKEEKGCRGCCCSGSMGGMGG